MTLKTITSLLDEELLLWFRSYAKSTKQSQRSLMEAALIQHREYLEKKELRESFIRASSDPQMKEMAEEGISEFSEDIDLITL